MDLFTVQPNKPTSWVCICRQTEMMRMSPALTITTTVESLVITDIIQGITNGTMGIIACL